MPELRPGAVAWVWLDPAVGREHGGNRPVVCVSSDSYLSVVDSMLWCVPVTTVDRGWPNQVRLTGPELLLSQPSFAMTEQLRTISRARIKDHAGTVAAACLAQIRWWIDTFLAP
ncbi:MAG: type II toxin-antitoxin system PemK/MazF family toxin [Bifidobacteriaceae bacterium]|jgi:mRNA interferase MazF|nr:type II toxin-antitoxin system PemK/MazF family toxin [Bifidobacteriaceae bacterium]